MKLIFVRHGEPDYTTDSLTPKGVCDAKILSDRVARWKVDELYVSPLGRARQTASYSEEKLGMKPEVLPWLAEFDTRVKDPDTGEERIAWDFYPEYFSADEKLHDRKSWTQADVMKTGDIDAAYKYVTSNFDSFLESHGYKRAGEGLYEVVRHNDDTIVFFCHFALMSLLVGHLTGIAAPCLWQGFFCATTGVTVVGTEERIPGQASFRVQVFGCTKHLSEAGEQISSSGYFTDCFEG